MALISLEGMEFFAHHGCFKEEQIIGSNFSVDLEVASDVSASEASDILSDTIDYQILYDIVKEQMMVRADLLEHLCRRILDTITDRFPSIQYAKVKISKMNPPLGGKLEKASLTLEYLRNRKQ